MKHDTDSEHCWCKPDFRQVCPECNGGSPPNKDCWRCKNVEHGPGLVEPYDDDLPTIIIHQETP